MGKLKLPALVAILCTAMTANASEAYVAGALRNTGSGWEVIDDASHAPLNIAKVSSDKKSITIEYGRTFSKVRTLTVTPDETYAVKLGLICGSSVTRSKATIFCASNGKMVDPRELTEKLGNLWVFGLMAE